MSLLCAFFRNVDIFRLWLRNEHRHVTLHLIRGSLLMNALTAVHNNAVASGQAYRGFTLIPSAQSPRLLELTFTEPATEQFLGQVARWSEQDRDYTSTL